MINLFGQHASNGQNADYIFRKQRSLIPIALLRRINVRIRMFLEDMLVMAQTLKVITQAKETLIFLLQNLGFMINFKKSHLSPVKKIEFLEFLE